MAQSAAAGIEAQSVVLIGVRTEAETAVVVPVVVEEEVEVAAAPDVEAAVASAAVAAEGTRLFFRIVMEGQRPRLNRGLCFFREPRRGGRPHAPSRAKLGNAEPPAGRSRVGGVNGTGWN